ncbi:hypothetical protein PROFUN_07307 [Planoprotostelium fungivorum]|uniref:Uncharacterized protein n=1 Tax=Planoprotostelium fungivorum TaxID=1890364 RepID=A0A2P6NM63_9EUKA|nr:hypothetical protein PROFUN_07307 [Planoprotostelium fungivorum]
MSTHYNRPIAVDILHIEVSPLQGLRHIFRDASEDRGRSATSNAKGDLVVVLWLDLLHVAAINEKYGRYPPCTNVVTESGESRCDEAYHLDSTRPFIKAKDSCSCSHSTAAIDSTVIGNFTVLGSCVTRNLMVRRRLYIARQPEWSPPSSILTPSTMSNHLISSMDQLLHFRHQQDNKRRDLSARTCLADACIRCLQHLCLLPCWLRELESRVRVLETEIDSALFEQITVLYRWYAEMKLSKQFGDKRGTSSLAVLRHTLRVLR